MIAAVTTAVTASSSSWLTKAATIERRVMPWRRDSDIWATTGQTLPGMYLPSWLAEYTPTDSASPTCWLNRRFTASPPGGGVSSSSKTTMSSSSRRQPTARLIPASTASSVDTPKRAQPTWGRAAVTSGQLFTNASTHAATRATTSTGRPYVRSTFIEPAAYGAVP